MSLKNNENNKVCVICGVHFRTGGKKGRLTAKFCSIKCKTEFQRKNWKGPNHPSWRGGKQIAGKGYVRVYFPNHSKSYRNKVYEHRLVIENYLGRELKNGEEIHHVNGNKTDNRLSNLIVISRSEHMKLEWMVNKNMGNRYQNLQRE